MLPELGLQDADRIADVERRLGHERVGAPGELGRGEGPERREELSELGVVGLCPGLRENGFEQRGVVRGRPGREDRVDNPPG